VAKPIVNNALIELHVVTLTLQDDDPAANRREEEKRCLLHRMVRSKGCTDKNHPRARLLIALHGFARCGDRNKADLQRWRDNYSHLPQHQKKVWDLETVAMNW
jgi:carnosine N-methyltransferase